MQEDIGVRQQCSTEWEVGSAILEMTENDNRRLASRLRRKEIEVEKGEMSK